VHVRHDQVELLLSVPQHLQRLLRVHHHRCCSQQRENKSYIWQLISKGLGREGD
jgi:hypothetical protein